MDVGTVEILANEEEQTVRRRGLSSGTSSGSGGGQNPGGGGNDSGGDLPDPSERQLDDQFVPSKSRILTGSLIVVVTMTFGGLLAAYVVIATNNSAEWKPFSLPIQVWLSTALIILSSIVYHLGTIAVQRNDQPAARKWFIATTVLGAAFISSQILVWLELRSRGLYVQGNPYAGFFYILTAVHAVHVIGGIIALGSILLRNMTPTDKLLEIEKRRTLARVVGWYWHFMGVLWLVLFVMLGFWR